MEATINYQTTIFLEKIKEMEDRNLLLAYSNKADYNSLFNQLAEEELATDLHLVRQWRAILRRPALHHVADVDVGAADRHALACRRAVDHLRQQLAGPADERDALRIFVRARPLTMMPIRSPLRGVHPLSGDTLM